MRASCVFAAMAALVMAGAATSQDIEEILTDDTVSAPARINDATAQAADSTGYVVEEVTPAPDVRESDGETIGRDKPHVNRDEISAAIRTGRALTTAGLVLHAGGFAMTLIGSLKSTTQGYLDDPGYYILSYGGLLLAATGPVLSVVGANRVDATTKPAGLTFAEQHVGREYAIGWALKGASVGLGLATTLIILNTDSPDAGDGVLVLVMALSGIATQILGEVMWMRCVIHARIFTGKADRALRRQAGGIPLDLRPVVYSTEKAGLVCSVGF